MAKESKTAKAVRKAVAAGQEKKAEEKTTNSEMIRQIRLNLGAGLSTSNFFIQGLLEEYDKERAAVVHLAGSTAALLKRAEIAEEAVQAPLKVFSGSTPEEIDGPLPLSSSEQLQAELEPIQADATELADETISLERQAVGSQIDTQS